MDKSMQRWLFLIAVIVLVLVLDQATKRLIISSLALGESYPPIPALRDVFQLTRSENTGAAFGFLPNAGDIFLVIAVVVTSAMVYFYRKLPDSAWLSRFAFGLICAGALGNALDRIQYGAVIDFIHYRIPGVVSNVSNLADHAIVIGVILVFIESWREDRARKLAELEQREETP